MKLKVTGGTLEVEVVEGSLNIDDVRKLLLKNAEVEDSETKESIKKAGDNTKVKPGNPYTGKLGVKPKMPI